METHFGRPKRQSSVANSGTKVVSEYWLRKCLALGELLHVGASPTYVPLQHKLPIPAMRRVNLVSTGAGTFIIGAPACGGSPKPWTGSDSGAGHRECSRVLTLNFALPNFCAADVSTHRSHA